MKLHNHLFTSLCTFALVACTQSLDEPSENFSTSPSKISNSITRSIEDAYKYAIEAANLLNENGESRNLETREIDFSQVQYLISENSRSNTDTILYIINYTDSLGYAIISAKTATEPILAVTEKGQYDTSNTQTNQGMNLFMNMAKDYVIEKSSLPITPTDPGLPITETKYETVVLADKNVAPRITVNWGQTGLYGMECPNRISGCSNTAAAQAMTYFNYPSSIKLGYDNNTTLTLDWNNIKKHINGISSTESCCSSTTHSTISKLLRQIGYDANSNYTSDGRGTLTSRTNLRNAMLKYGFKVGAITNYSNYCIVSQLGSGIILIRGQENNNAGHMWVADGYKYKKQEYRTYTRPQYSTKWTLLSTEVQIFSYNHFNWGYDGKDNGYFNENVFSMFNGDYKYEVMYFTVNR